MTSKKSSHPEKTQIFISFAEVDIHISMSAID